MYRAVMKMVLRRVFRELSRGNFEYSLRKSAIDVEHIFPGRHALGGTRHSQAALRKWFQRLNRLFPGLTFTVNNIAVTGWPWDTAAAIEWVDSAKLPDGSAYHNRGAHWMRIKWGRVVSIHAYLDTLRVAEACEHLSRLGIAEAAAAPIID